jgi:hypothetical protein
MASFVWGLEGAIRIMEINGIYIYDYICICSLSPIVWDYGFENRGLS